MSARYYILLPGIRTNPKDWSNWSVKMASDINLKTDSKAEEFRYLALAITPKSRQDERARYVASLAHRAFEQGYTPVLVGHSNGCEVIRQALSHLGCVVSEVHLIAGATDEDFERGGWNQALRDGKVGTIHVYTGARDCVLRTIAKIGSFLGYGRLGYTGPKNVDSSVYSKLRTIPSNHDHNSWFSEKCYDGTFWLVTHPAK
jgi:hypothetical protein